MLQQNNYVDTENKITMILPNIIWDNIPEVFTLLGSVCDCKILDGRACNSSRQAFKDLYKEYVIRFENDKTLSERVIEDLNKLEGALQVMGEENFGHEYFNKLFIKYFFLKMMNNTPLPLQVITPFKLSEPTLPVVESVVW